MDALARGAPRLTTLLTPFDHVVFRPHATAWRRGTTRDLADLAAMLACAWPEQPLAALGAVNTAPWPHQLEPVLAILDGRGARLLIADAVGLGKTLTASLILAELAARGVGARALVLTPAGLRDQWRDELARHTGIASEVVDWASLAARSREAFAGASPWSSPGCAIVSLDFAKQPAVLAGLTRLPWDVLVVDEAHGAAGESYRRAAVAELARLSRVVVLLSATPHAGDRRAFRSLTALGAHDSTPILWFAHRSTDVRPGAIRHTRTWSPSPTAGERAVLEALRAYACAVGRDGTAESRLAMVVLKKRALSSAAALERSLQHRRRLLGDAAGSQLLLPLEGPPGETDSTDRDQDAWLGAPGLPDRASEISTLDALTHMAATAARSPSKWRAIDRVLRWTREPVLVFTEYRDTLAALERHLAHLTTLAVLHGGLTREDRAHAVRQFISGAARTLLATDAAAEGLNLQARCRLVINVELPWTPARLEQRVGRLDRLGQRRAVHEWRLMGARGHEASVVASLLRRANAIRADLGAEPAFHDVAWEHLPPSAPLSPAPLLDPMMNRQALHAAEAAAMVRPWRAWRESTRHRRDGRVARAPRYVWLRHPCPFGRGVIFVFAAAPRGAGDGDARTAVHVSLSRMPDGPPDAWLPAIAAVAARAVRPDMAAPRALLSRLARRERAIRAGVREAPRRRWQPSLFDRRAARAVEAARATALDIERACNERLADLGATGRTGCLPVPVLALLAP